MRTLQVAAAVGIAAAVIVAPSPSWAKLQCKPGQVVKCNNMGKAAPPMCWCAAKPGSGFGTGSGGKPEIKKKNVPTVQPSK